MDQNHDWLTFHRVRFAHSVDGVGKPLPGPTAAEFWRFAPSMKIGPEGMIANDPVWGGFGLYTSQSDAEDVINAPEAHLPFLENAIEAWHALVIPYAHRGTVHWRKEVQTDSAIKPAFADPKGPLIIITTAGYDSADSAKPQRVRTFLNGVLEVVNHYRALSGNVRADVFSAGPVDGREGCTVSLWHDDKAMMAAAYKGGEHKAQLDYHKMTPHFDRSSFTRGRIIASAGKWDGTDPVKDMAAA